MVKKFRKHSRTGVTFISAIAIALGGTAVVSTPAAAQDASGENTENVTLDSGIGKNSKYNGTVGLVSEAQNNLPAGSCSFSYGAGDGDNGIANTAGLRYWTTNPSPTSSDKRTFGIDLHFDNSQGRTFVEWSVTDSVKSLPASRANLPALEKGSKAVKEGTFITHTADEIAKVSGKRQNGFDVSSELTGEKIAEMASDKGVTIGWRGKYSQDNPNEKFFNGENFGVYGTVNPWPGEYNNCSPIKVTWESIEKKVITPGEPQRIGKVDLGTDGAELKNRLVVEAYDSQGKFLGTSDPAESGGEKLLEIGADGTMTLTWPKYVGTELNAQQGIRFAVFAKPRSVDELKAIAAADDATYNPVVADESVNTLERYNKPNLLSTWQGSLDDTQFHDPFYEEPQRTIISGVESKNGPVATEPQRVTFKQNPKKPEFDLRKLKENNNATIELDTEHVYSGWKAEMDPNTYEVTVTAPKNPLVGTFAMPKVIVTYSNGSQDILPLLVTVAPNDTQKTDLTSGGLVKGAPGSTMTSNLTRTPVYNKRPASTPKEWKVEGVPEGWTVKVENDTVTAVAPADAPHGTKITPTVTAVYPDGTTDTVTVQFAVEQNVKVPRYASESGKPGDSLTLTPTQPPTGLGGNEADEEPNRYTFPDDSLEYTVGDWKVTIDPKTGELTTTVPESALPGAFITVPVKTHYASGSPAQQTSGTYVVIGDGTGTDVANYPPRVTRAGQPVESKLNTQLKNPESATYTLPPRSEWPAGWEFTIDKAGNVTSTPPADAAPNTRITIPVKVNYPDGSEGEVPAEVKVVGTDAEANDPQYPTERGKPGDEVTSTVDTSRMQPGKKTYSIIKDPKAPGYIAPPARLGSWDNVTINPETGEILTPIPENALPGSSADIPVLVTYKDGTKDITKATVVVEGERSQVYSPEYKQQVTKPGKEVGSKVLTAAKKEDLAAENAYSVPKKVGEWEVRVDENGQVFAKPPADAKSGDSIDVPVKVTYEDGSSKEVFAAFVVQTLDKDVHEPVYPVESTTPGKPVKRNVAPPALPKGSTFKIDQPNNGWEYEINPQTGEITVTPPADAKPGDKDVQNVTVTYPDGSTEEVPVTTVVNLTNNYEAEPVYPAENVYPGEQATSPLKVERPEGLTFAKENPYTITPQGDDATNWTKTDKTNTDGNPIYTVKTTNGYWTVSLDKEGNVLSTAPATAKPGDLINVPVTVKYSDGSTDIAKAPIAVVDRPTRELPFDVVYEYDENLPAGTYKVEKEGAPGSEHQLKDRTWEKTKEPVNEVVKIGTKQAVANDKVEWTAPIPYDTILRENPALKPGEVKEVQAGELGEKRYTADFKGQEGNASTNVKLETLKQSTARIVEYGPGLDPQELVTTTKKPVPFGVKVIKDPNLPAGTFKTEQKGEAGEETETSTQKLVNGKPSGDPVVEKKQTKAPKEEIIRVGTKPAESTKSESWKEPVPFDTEFKPNPALKPGEVKVKVEGTPGEKTVTVNTKTVGTETTIERTQNVDTPAVNRVVEYGPTPADTEVTDTVERDVPFETEVVEDPTLPVGTIVRETEGKPGKETVTTTQKIVAGKPEGKPTQTVNRTQEPVNGKVRVGTGKVSADAPYNIKYETDPNLEAGKYEVVTPGKPGKQEYQNDGTWKVTEAPTDEVVKIGTKQPTGAKDVTWTVPTMFETELRPNPALAAGEIKEVQPGKQGETTHTAKFAFDGTQATVMESTETKAPQKRIVEYGPSLGETSLVTTTKKPVPFEVEVIEDPNLPAGTVQTEQNGEAGEETETSTQKLVDGKPSGDAVVKSKRTKEPVKHIIRVGTKPAETPAPKTLTEKVPFKTEFRINRDLEPGTTRVLTQGVPGEKTITVTTTNVNGKIEVTTEENVTTAPVTHVVEYNPDATTGEVTDTVERDIPFQTKVIEDPTLEAGKVIREKEGVLGKEKVTTTQKVEGSQPVGDPVETTEIITPAVDAVIRVGTKPADPSVTPGDDNPGTKPGDKPGGEPGGQPGGEPGTKPGDKPGTEPGDKPSDKPGDNPDDKPADPNKSSNTWDRCVANFSSANNPLLWLIPIGIMAAIGVPVARHLQPQINQAIGNINAQFNALTEQHRRNQPNFGNGGHGVEQPEWMRQAQAELQGHINRANEAFAPYQKYAEPVGIGLGIVAAGLVALGLMYQACTPEGFNNWGSSNTGDADNSGSSATDGGSSEAGAAGSESSNGGSSTK